MKIKEKPMSFTSYQKFMIAILAILQFTIILDFMILSPLGDILMKSMEISPNQFGWVVSAYAFSAGISGILAAGFADKFDRKKMLMFFYTGFVLGTLFCGLANTYHLLLLARIVTDIFEINQRGRVMGFIQMAFAASQVLGLPIGLYLAAKWNWHITFYMIVVLATIIGITVILKMKPIKEHLLLQSNKSPLLHLWHTIRNKEYRRGFLATAFLSAGGFMLMPFGSSFLVNNIGISQIELPIIYMFTGISSIIIMPIIGKISDKYDKFKIFTFGSLLAVIMVIFYTNLTSMPLWGIIVTNMIMFMGIMSRMIPASIFTTAIPEMKDRGAFMSINASLQQMSGGIAAVLAGLVITQQTKTSPLDHYNIVGYIVATISFISIYLTQVSHLTKSILSD